MCSAVFLYAVNICVNINMTLRQQDQTKQCLKLTESDEIFSTNKTVNVEKVNNRVEISTDKNYSLMELITDSSLKYTEGLDPIKDILEGEEIIFSKSAPIDSGAAALGKSAPIDSGAAAFGKTCIDKKEIYIVTNYTRYIKLFCSESLKIDEHVMFDFIFPKELLASIEEIGGGCVKHVLEIAKIYHYRTLRMKLKYLHLRKEYQDLMFDFTSQRNMYNSFIDKLDDIATKLSEINDLHEKLIIRTR